MRDDFLFPQIPDNATDKQTEELIGFWTADTKEWIKKQMEKIKEDKLWQYGKMNFMNDDETPWEMSPGELEIYRMIVLREHSRNQIVSSTQYGKTLTVSRGVLTRITTYPEEWLIVAPDMKRGRILLSYIIRDAANNEYFKDKLMGVNIRNDSLMLRLLEEKSKIRLTFQILEDKELPRYGSVTILSCDARRKQNAIHSIMGFGGRNIICLPFSEQILTEQGYLKIGEIVENRLKVKVCSYNHKTDKTEFKKIEEYQKNESEELIEIDVGDKKMTCTTDHPIYVKGKGYVKAEDIKLKDIVWVLED